MWALTSRPKRSHHVLNHTRPRPPVHLFVMAQCANPLLLAWVEEWLQVARERNSKGVTVYRKASESLRACPLAFSHPSEAKMLNGIGEKLCQRLTEKMEKHCEENGLPMPKRSRKASTALDGDPDPVPKKRAKSSLYVPKIRSGAYALLLALGTLKRDEEIHKEALIQLAQEHCDSSFTVPNQANKYYTAWSSMKTLIDKDFVSEKGRPVRKYALTDEGMEVADRIRKSHDPSRGLMDEFVSRRSESPVDDGDISSRRNPLEPAVNSDGEVAEDGLIPRGVEISDPSALPNFTSGVLTPDMFTIEMVLDTREIRAKQDRDYIQNELAKNGVTPIVRALELGDILWVAKVKNPESSTINSLQKRQLVSS